MGKNQHVIPFGDNWAIKGEGDSRCTLICATQAECVEKAIEIATTEQAELIVHGKDGKILGRDFYGGGSVPPKRKWDLK